MSGVRVARLDQLAPIAETQDGVGEWLPVRHHLGIRAFGVNAWLGREAGAPVIEDHDELPSEDDTAGHEELYVVVAGRARFVVAGEEIDAPTGTLVFVSDPALPRRAIAEEAGTTVLTVGAAPNVPFRISPWEARHVARLAGERDGAG